MRRSSAISPCHTVKNVYCRPRCSRELDVLSRIDRRRAPTRRHLRARRRRDRFAGCAATAARAVHAVQPSPRAQLARCRAGIVRGRSANAPVSTGCSRGLPSGIRATISRRSDGARSRARCTAATQGCASPRAIVRCAAAPIAAAALALDAPPLASCRWRAADAAVGDDLRDDLRDNLRDNLRLDGHLRHRLLRRPRLLARPARGRRSDRPARRPDLGTTAFGAPDPRAAQRSAGAAT